MSQFSSSPFDSDQDAPVFVQIPDASQRVPRRKGVILPVILFLLTCVTTLVAGYLFHVQFVSQTPEEYSSLIFQVFFRPLELLKGFPFALSILAILMFHEFGHFLTCRYYGISATLPYVIPAPPLLMPFGTFGAVIKIRSPFQDRKQLFDVGIAGPLAGFILILPVLALGLVFSTEYVSIDSTVLVFGEPLLFQLGTRLFFPGDAAFLNLHPVGWAAWFGMLATSLNLLPIGQLDGGHIVYALFGERGHRLISFFTFGGLILIGLLSWPMLGYLVFAVLLLLLRFRHPRPYIDLKNLGRGRYILAVVGLIIFLMTFIPVPIQIVEQHYGSL